MFFPQCDHGLNHTYCESHSCNGAKVKADEIIDHYMRCDLKLGTMLNRQIVRGLVKKTSIGCLNHYVAAITVLTYIPSYCKLESMES